MVDQKGPPHGGMIQHRLLLRHLYTMVEEDLGAGDVTTSALITSTQRANARIFSRQAGVVAGVELAATFLSDLGLKVHNHLSDGTQIKVNTNLLEASGSAATLLIVERPLLNLLMRMSGIATLTANMVAAAKRVNPKVRIAATRKTAPLLRIFDKLAVIAGGGDPHRWRLDDAVLIKDNHLALVGRITEAIQCARQRVSFTTPIEVEVRSIEDAVTAAQAGADAILFDNMSPSDVSAAVKATRGLSLPRIPILEVSGNITLETVSKYAATGVDIISAGILTHSVAALNLSLDLSPCKETSTNGGNSES